MLTLQINAKDLLLDKHDVAEIFKVSEMTIDRLIKDSDFPKPFRLKNNQTATPFWRIEDVKSWIDSQYES